MVLKIVTMLVIAAAAFATASCRRTAPESTAPSRAVSLVQPGAPGQASRELPPGTPAPRSPKHTAADVAFMQGMIHHHAQAVEMVELLRTHTRREDMKRLGQRIEVSQTDEIKMMTSWLADRGAEIPMDHGHGMMMMAGAMMGPMPGMLTAARMAALEGAKGPAFDRLFLTGMIQHHEGALAMVADLLKSPGAGQESTLFDFVTHVDADQRMEIARMRQILREPR